MDSKDISNIKKNMYAIIDLYKSGCRYAKKYMEIAEEVTINLDDISESSTSGIVTQLQEHMDSRRMLAIEHGGSKQAKLLFGLFYIQNTLWEYLRDAGIGALLEFHAENSFVGKISLGMKLKRKDNETTEEYEKRKEETAQMSPISYSENWEISATEQNHNVLLGIIKSLFGDCLYTLKEHGGEYISIEFRTTHIQIPKTGEFVESRNTAAVLERVAAEAENIIGCIDMIEEYPSVCENAIHVAAGSYYEICKRLGCCNSYIIKYENRFASNKDKNMDTKKLIEKIGSDVMPEEVLEIAKEASSKIEEKMEKEYGLYIHPYFTQHGMEAVVNIYHVLPVQCQHMEKKWMKTTFGGSEAVIAIDFIEDFIKDMEKEGLDVVSYQTNHSGSEPAYASNIKVYTSSLCNILGYN